MLKLVGAALVVGAGALVGFQYSEGYRVRPALLRQLVSGLGQLETEIVYRSLPLATAFERVATRVPRASGALFGDAAIRLGDGGRGAPAASCWQAALSEWDGLRRLRPLEIEILLSFGQSLGTSDVDDQVRHLRATQAELSRVAAEAEAERDRLSGLSRYLGACTGLVVAILLA